MVLVKGFLVKGKGENYKLIMKNLCEFARIYYTQYHLRTFYIFTPDIYYLRKGKSWARELFHHDITLWKDVTDMIMTVSVIMIITITVSVEGRWNH